MLQKIKQDKKLLIIFALMIFLIFILIIFFFFKQLDHFLNTTVKQPKPIFSAIITPTSKHDIGPVPAQQPLAATNTPTTPSTIMPLVDKNLKQQPIPDDPALIQDELAQLKDIQTQLKEQKKLLKEQHKDADELLKLKQQQLDELNKQLQSSSS